MSTGSAFVFCPVLNDFDSSNFGVYVGPGESGDEFATGCQLRGTSEHLALFVITNAVASGQYGEWTDRIKIATGRLQLSLALIESSL